MLLIDGLGAGMLEASSSAMPRLASAWHKAGLPVARACFPTTTATCLPSLGRAASPAEHGLVGHSFIDTARHPIGLARPSHLAEGAPALVLGRAPALLPRGSALLTTNRLRSPSFAREAFPGAVQICIEASAAIAECVAQTAAKHDLVFLYSDELDHAAHREGLGSARHLAAMREADVLYGELTHLLDRLTLVVIADHGMVPVSHWHRLEDFISAENLIGVAGEARAVHLYTCEGRMSALHESCRDIPQALVLTRGELESCGLLDGAARPGVMARVGDLVLTFEQPDVGITWAGGPGERRAPAQHGGLSDDELFVPFVCHARHV